MRLLLLILSFHINASDTLDHLINTPGTRESFIQDAVILVNQEIHKKTGFFGFTIRNTYKLVRRLDNGTVIDKSISNMLDEFLIVMEPFHQSYAQLNPDSRSDFSSYLLQYNDEVTQALLTISDGRREKVTNRFISGTYDRFRPYAETHVSEAVPAIGRLIATYAY